MLQTHTYSFASLELNRHRCYMPNHIMRRSRKFADPGYLNLAILGIHLDNMISRLLDDTLNLDVYMYMIIHVVLYNVTIVYYKLY